MRDCDTLTARRVPRSFQASPSNGHIEDNYIPDNDLYDQLPFTIANHLLCLFPTAICSHVASFSHRKLQKHAALSASFLFLSCHHNCTAINASTASKSRKIPFPASPDSIPRMIVHKLLCRTHLIYPQPCLPSYWRPTPRNVSSSQLLLLLPDLTLPPYPHHNPHQDFRLHDWN